MLVPEKKSESVPLTSFSERVLVVLLVCSAICDLPRETGYGIFKPLTGFEFWLHCFWWIISSGYLIFPEGISYTFCPSRNLTMSPKLSKSHKGFHSIVIILSIPKRSGFLSWFLTHMENICSGFRLWSWPTQSTTTTSPLGAFLIALSKDLLFSSISFKYSGFCMLFGFVFRFQHHLLTHLDHFLTSSFGLLFCIYSWSQSLSYWSEAQTST